AFGDAGALDTHEVNWDFGDGTSTGWSPASGYAAAAPAHVYAATGTYTVSVSVRDDDGGVTTFSHWVTVKAAELQADPSDPSKTALVVGGTTGDDVIAVSPVGNTGELVVHVNGVLEASLKPTGSVLVYAQAGN